MDDAGGRYHARRAYRGCWLLQQDAPEFDRQQRSGHCLCSIDADRFVARTRDVSRRLRERIRLGLNRSAN